MATTIHVLTHADVFLYWLEDQRDTRRPADSSNPYSNMLAFFIADFGHSNVSVDTHTFTTEKWGTRNLPKWAKRYQQLEREQDDSRISIPLARQLMAQVITEFPNT
ncbi:MAG: hypothetical protein H0X24_12055 [Ktedonobacterales bacterium]|nr:hypothetical protein [Ktedonobacterales bacterium]